MRRINAKSYGLGRCLRLGFGSRGLAVGISGLRHARAGRWNDVDRLDRADALGLIHRHLSIMLVLHKHKCAADDMVQCSTAKGGILEIRHFPNITSRPYLTSSRKPGALPQ